MPTLSPLSRTLSGFTFGLAILTLVVSGCATTVYEVATDVPSTYTPTPLSIPLPTVGTLVPLGATGNPYHMAFVSTKSDLNVSALATYLTAQTGAAFIIDKVTTTAQALQESCSSPSFVWMDTTGVLAAAGQGCGTLALKYEQKNGSTPTAALQVDVITRSVGNDALRVMGDLKGRIFCRVSEQDLTSWVIPAMLMRDAKLDPVLDLGSVKEFADVPSLLQAVASGPCAATGIVSGSLTGPHLNLTIPNGVNINVIKTSPAVPLGGLIISKGVPKAIADKVATILSTDPTPLRALITADQLAPAAPADFANFTQLMQSAGVDFAALGR